MTYPIYQSYLKWKKALLAITAHWARIGQYPDKILKMFISIFTFLLHENFVMSLEYMQIKH